MVIVLTAKEYGRSQNKQRYYCKSCKKTWLASYNKQACLPFVNQYIIALKKEDCGIRSTARLLRISATTVISRIQKIADSIKKPIISTGRTYDVNELKTYIRKKNNDYWVIYALERESRQVIDFKVGKCIKKVTYTLPRPAKLVAWPR